MVASSEIGLSKKVECAGRVGLLSTSLSTHGGSLTERGSATVGKRMALFPKGFRGTSLSKSGLRGRARQLISKGGGRGRKKRGNRRRGVRRGMENLWKESTAAPSGANQRGKAKRETRKKKNWGVFRGVFSRRKKMCNP